MSDEQQKVSNRIHEGRFTPRESVAETIGSAPSTILINMVIEIVAAAILVFGVVYLVRFMFVYRNMMNDMHFRFFLIALIFLAAGWGTHISLKIRSHIARYRQAIARNDSHRNR